MRRSRIPVAVTLAILIVMIAAAPGHTDQTKYLAYAGPYHRAFANQNYDVIPANTASVRVTGHDQNVPQIALHYEFSYYTYQTQYICVDPDPYNCYYVTLNSYHVVSSGDFCQTATLAVPSEANRFRVYPTIDSTCGPVPTVGTMELTYIIPTT